MTGILNTISDHINDIETDLREIENNHLLYEEINFDERSKAIDFIEFHILDRIESLSFAKSNSNKLNVLKLRAEKIISRLEEINKEVFQKFRDNISNGNYRGNTFKEAVKEYINIDLRSDANEEGYDNLDLFINGLFPDEVPEQTMALEPEMVFYQKTPAQLVFEIAEKITITDQDIFFDIGSGLGQVGILLNLLTAVTTTGVEFEPAFVNYAADCAEALKLTNISFINADARNADYSGGTIFFLYTPFKGEILQRVLDKLKKESLNRKITIITYGPCTWDLAAKSWLKQIDNYGIDIYKPIFFCSK